VTGRARLRRKRMPQAPVRQALENMEKETEEPYENHDSHE
jgi:hypothetical protein